MIFILSIGKIKNKNINDLIIEYKKRISFLKIELIEIKESNYEKEKKEIFGFLEKINRKKVFLLADEGKSFDSLEFSNLIKNSLNNNENLIFIIGNYYGFDNHFKKKFSLISLSKMTFPHELAKLLLLEQIYRSETIIKNKNYHK
ncbi:MAG: 23S rRNA (pseudouridine(1915)-N(3))-methyltransferase RlmH [Candidatus Woesearchaeota archaeon]